MQPRYMRPPVAAEFVGVPLAYLKSLRARDRQLLAAGKKTLGPPWVEHITKSGCSIVSYPADELNEWADSYWTHSGSSPPKTSLHEETSMNERIQPRTYGQFHKVTEDIRLSVPTDAFEDKAARQASLLGYEVGCLMHKYGYYDVRLVFTREDSRLTKYRVEAKIRTSTDEVFLQTKSCSQAKNACLLAHGMIEGAMQTLRQQLHIRWAGGADITASKGEATGNNDDWT